MAVLLPLIIKGLLLTVIMMAILWTIQLKSGNAGIVDFGWALGLALLAALYGALGPGYGPRRALMAAMGLFWGLRLAFHILTDRVIAKPEDPFYRNLRAEWKSSAPWKFFFFFEFQALLDVVLATPFLIMSVNPAPGLTILEWMGFGLWVIALGGESLADRQLKHFKSNPANKGKVCQEGLWNYSRHPNYFFEWLIWMAYLTATLASPYGWVSIICPALMLYILLKVTGIPARETESVKSRGDAYREYQRTTSAFVPWFKKEA